MNVVYGKLKNVRNLQFNVNLKKMSFNAYSFLRITEENKMNLGITIMMILGGLGIFLYGINLMGDSLKELAGDKLKVIIEKTTNTPIKGILVGALVTAIIQSSSGTTALTVGLVRAGLLSFPQAVGIIMGANIGTTITAFIVGLNIEGASLWFVAIGAILIFFFKKDKIKKLGSIILGFGLLFYGLGLMGDSLKELLATYEEQTSTLFKWLADSPIGWIMGLFVGTGVTAVVQSSSATISIVQKLYGQGSIPLMGAIPILLGCNIGTTVTAMFACIGGGTQAKRTSFVHAIFNIFGAVLFMILLVPYTALVQLIEDAILGPIGADPSMTLAFAHIIFNVVTTFILYFLVNKIVALATKVIKDTETDENKILDELLDYSLINRSSVLALSFVKKAIDYMGANVKRFVYISKEYSFKRNDDYLIEGEKLEKTINSLDKRIHDYLIKLMITDLDAKSSNKLSKYLDQIKDFERIGDHCNNLLGFFKERYENNMELSIDGTQDLEQIYNVLVNMTELTVKAITNWSIEEAKEAAKYEEEIDKLEEIFHNRHIHRLNNGICSVLNSEHFIEILTNIERMGDHLENICESVIIENSFQYDEYNH